MTDADNRILEVLARIHLGQSIPQAMDSVLGAGTYATFAANAMKDPRVVDAAERKEKWEQREREAWQKSIRWLP